MGNIQPGGDGMKTKPVFKGYSCIFFLRLFPLFALMLAFVLLFFNGCGVDPVSPSTVISGTDNLFAPKNGDATFTFSSGNDTYGSFQLKAYVTTAIIQTPTGGGVQKSDQNLDTAPEDNYIVSEECGYYYYYMKTDFATHFAKIFIHTITTDANGITIGFNWWLQTEANNRDF
jgi:hypothetical protein